MVTDSISQNQSGAEAVDRAVIRKLEKIKTLQGKTQRIEVKEKFAMGNARNIP